MTALWKRIFFAAVLPLFAAAAAPAECWEDVLYQRDDTYLVMESGVAFRIIGDARDIELWFPLSLIQVCDQQGYVNGEWTTYFEIRNSDAAGVVSALPAP
ncbi:MAG TPA: hypothetical protein VGH50_15720 [Candidatus Binatia bacterium]|jgi:hypothetical protein